MASQLKNIMVRCPPGLYKKLKIYLAMHDKKLQTFMCQLIEDFIEKESRKDPLLSKSIKNLPDAKDGACGDSDEAD